VRALLEAYTVITDPSVAPADRQRVRMVFHDYLDGLSEQEATAYYAGVVKLRESRIAAEPPSWTMDDLRRDHPGEEVEPVGQAQLFSKELHGSPKADGLEAAAQALETK
jgi:hypothetical protein